MQLYPAIDLLAGQSVRLTQGDYRQVSLTADPLIQVKNLTAAGLKHLHSGSRRCPIPTASQSSRH